jgi:hypothetical protein
VPDKGTFRNPLIHEIAKKVKRSAQKKYQDKEIKLFFDPSHSLGPKMRDQIPAAIIAALKMTDDAGFLYDGILVETGTSKTDTDQHITIAELQAVINEVAKFRIILERD